MSNPNPDTTTAAAAPARTHGEAAELLRRPFAPGAIGFRAMTKVTLGGVPYGGAQVAAFLNAQSVVQRLNHVVPGCWRQQFTPVPPSCLAPPARKKLYLACRLIDHPPDRGWRPRRRRRLRGHRRDGRRLVRRAEGAVLRRAQARRGRRRDRRLPVHGARAGGAADRARRPGRCRRSAAARARATCSPSRPRPSSGSGTATRRG